MHSHNDTIACRLGARGLRLGQRDRDAGGRSTHEPQRLLARALLECHPAGERASSTSSKY
jgi:hypothetical protein